MLNNNEKLVYHRLESPTQTSAHASKQQASGELWGRASRIGGAIACVKAYRGPLPPHARGIEFVTDVRPTAGCNTPIEVRWYADGTAGVLLNRQGYAVISVQITKNTQVP